MLIICKDMDVVLVNMQPCMDALVLRIGASASFNCATRLGSNLGPSACEAVRVTIRPLGHITEISTLAY